MVVSWVWFHGINSGKGHAQMSMDVVDHDGGVLDYTQDDKDISQTNGDIVDKKKTIKITNSDVVDEKDKDKFFQW